VNNAPLRQAPLFDDRSKIIPFRATRPAARTAGGAAPRPGARATLPNHRPAVRGCRPSRLASSRPQEKKAVNDDAPVARPATRLQAALLDAAFVAVG